MAYLLECMVGQTMLLAQDYSLVILVVLLCIFLGSVLIIIPRPRKKYLTATEHRDAKMRKVKRKRPAVSQTAAVPQPASQPRPPGPSR